MSVRTITENIDALYTTTLALRKKEIVNDAFLSSPFWYLMTKKNRMRSEEGGRWIEVNLNYAKNETTKFFSKGGTISLEDQDTLTTAYYNWRYLGTSIVQYFTDVQKNRGKAQIINKVNADLDNAKLSLIDKLETSLFTATAGDAIEGLPSLIANLPTTGTVGGINRASYDWWRNQYTSMSGESASVYLLQRMRTMFNKCGKYGEGITRFPTEIMTDQTSYELYEEEIVGYSQMTFNDKAIADLGFGDLAFKGRPITWSPSCPAGTMYFINHNFLEFVYDPIAFFEMTDWKQIPDQVNDKVAQIYVAGNLVQSSSVRQGVIHTIAE